MKQTITRYERLRLESDFRFVREHGSKLAGRLLVLVSADSPDGSFKSGVVCGRKFSLRAVDRNRARRLVWETLRRQRANIPPCHLTIIPRRAILHAKQPQVQMEMDYLLRQSGRWSQLGAGSPPPES